MQKEVNSGNSVPLYLFHQGTNMKAYEYMGLRKAADKDKTGMTCPCLGAERSGGFPCGRLQRMG